MKKYSFTFILFLLGISSLFICGCEDNRTEFFDEYSCIVYFLSENEREVNVYLTGEEAEDTLLVGKGGTNLGASTYVRLRTMSEQELNQYNQTNYTDYRYLPNTCYKVDGNYDLDFNGSETCKHVIYSINPAEINNLQDLNSTNYVIPFILENGKDSINENRKYQFVKPKVNIPSVGFSNSDPVKLSLSDGISLDGNLLIPISASIANNKLEVQCSYERVFVTEYQQYKKIKVQKYGYGKTGYKSCFLRK